MRKSNLQVVGRTERERRTDRIPEFQKQPREKSESKWREKFGFDTGVPSPTSTADNLEKGKFCKSKSNLECKFCGGHFESTGLHIGLFPRFS